MNCNFHISYTFRAFGGWIDHFNPARITRRRLDKRGGETEVCFILANVFQHDAINNFGRNTFIASIYAENSASATGLHYRNIEGMIAIRIRANSGVVFDQARRSLLRRYVDGRIFGSSLFTDIQIFGFRPQTAISRFATGLFAHRLMTPIFGHSFNRLRSITFIRRDREIAVIDGYMFSHYAGRAFNTFFQAQLGASAAVFQRTGFLRPRLFARRFGRFLNINEIYFPFSAHVGIFQIFARSGRVNRFEIFGQT